MEQRQPSQILVVNDDEIGRYAVSRILRQSGFEVMEAATGGEGLELAGSRPDLVLLDVNLPDIDGFEVSRRIKADPATAQTPVLHLSATFTDAESKVRGLESGADGYLTYPLEPTVLIATVRAHLRLREAEADRQNLAVVLQDVNDAIIVSTEDLVIQHWNRGAERIYGWTEADAVGKNLAELVCADESPGELEGILATLEEAGIWEGETLHRSRDGDVLNVQSSLTLAKGARYGSKNIVAVNRDVSELRKGEMERAQLVDELRQVNAELEGRVADRTRELLSTNRVLTSRSDELEALAYSISHDVRAPLRGIDGFSVVLGEEYGHQLDDEGRGYLDRIRNAARLMGDLIDHLLELSRLSRRSTTASNVDLTALARDVMAELTSDDPTIALEFVVEEGISVVGDDELLRTLVTHLLDNALKFSRSHEVAHIEFGSTKRDGETIYFVRDNGVGFDMQYSGKLFTAFQHLHPTSRFSGVGVGLATVRRIVHRHGGHIWAESAPDKGATFWFTLPNAPDSRSEAAPDEEVLGEA